MRKDWLCLLRNILVTGLWLALQGTPCRSQMMEDILPNPPEPAPLLESKIRTAPPGADKAEALLHLATIYLNRPFPHNFNLNKAMQLARQAESLSRAISPARYWNESQLLIAFIWLRKGFFDSATALLPKVNDSTRFKILLGISHSYRDAPFQDRQAISARAMTFALQAKDLSIRLNDTLKKILVSKEIACIHANTLQRGAEEELADVARQLKGVGYPLLHYTWFDLEVLEYYMGNYDKALHYSQLGLKSMAQTGDTSNAADLYLIHACILRKTGQHDASIEDFKLAIQYYKYQYGEEGFTDPIEYLTEEMVRLHRSKECKEIITTLYSACPPDNSIDSLCWLQTLSRYYRLTKDFPLAEKYLQRQVDIQLRLHFLPDYYRLGQIYLEAGGYAKAKPNLEKALKSMEYNYSVQGKAHLEYCLYLADSALGNYVSAIRHLSMNKRYDDTVMQQAKVDAVEKYKTEYQTEKKEAALKLKDQQISLLIKERQLKDMNLERARFIKNLALYGSFALLIIGILMNIQYRQKKKAHTIIARMNAELQQSLTEKEWLLREVHHRVKNNLHTIICLLESQAIYLEKDALQAIEKSQHRIYAMSLIHQKLYQNDDLQSIDMTLYLDEFIDYLKDSFDAGAIEFIVGVQPLQLNLQQAISVALIINESVTNSIKYAFDGNPSPKIWISMTIAGDLVKLVIADNGKGFQLKEEDERKSLGLQLIKGLAKELQGTVRIEATQGTRLVIEFTRENIADTIRNMQWSMHDYET